MIEVIEQTIDRAKLDHDLIVPITSSEPSSPSVLEVGPDGPPVVVRLFLSPWTTMGNGVGTGRPTGPRGALWNFPVWVSSAVFLETSS